MAKAERLLRKEEYTNANGFIKSLRHASDPPPRSVAPPIAFPGALPSRCAGNVARFCRDHPDHEPVKGFKLWVFDTLQKMGMPTPYVAQVHVVARHKTSGKYTDVTPADEGDEGQSLIFVPSSTVYATWSAWELGALCNDALEPRMGCVCQAAALSFKKYASRGDETLLADDAANLQLMVGPKISAIGEHVGMPTHVVAHALSGLGLRVCDVEGTQYTLMTADAFREVKDALVIVRRAMVERGVDPADARA